MWCNNNNIKFLTFLFVTIFNQISYSQETSDITIYSLPGQNGLGSETHYIKSIFSDNPNIIHVATPSIAPDLGQRFCQDHIKKALKDNKKPYILYATSQGTATALNYLSTHKDPNVKCVILESSIASGNSTIYHAVKGPLMNLKALTDMPGSYYWLPYFASIIHCRGYRPGGQQPIKSIDNIDNKDIPFIFIHTTHDPQTPFSGSQMLYYRLRERGHKTYLIQLDKMEHIQLLKTDEEKKILKAILAHHKLQKATLTDKTVNINTYQPGIEQFKSCYNKLIEKEQKHKIFERIFGASLAAVILGYVSYRQ